MDYRYEQGRDLRWTASGPEDQRAANTAAGAHALQTGKAAALPTITANGACQGISAWWIIKRSLGDDFWNWFGASKAAAPTGGKMAKAGEPASSVKDVMNKQALLGKIPSFSRKLNTEAVVNYILANTKPHLAQKRPLVVLQNQTFGTLAREISAVPGYVFIGFSHVGWGGHAIAAHVLQNGAIEFMDPNCGEFDVPDANTFHNWLANEVGVKLYKGMNLHTIEVQTLQRPSA